jgi:hypothetical protein
MKKSFHPVFGLGLLFLLAIVTTGCPVGIAYPLCEENKVEKLDKKLLGTWRSTADSAEILQVRITEEDGLTFGIEVLEKSDNYMADDTRFFGWTTKLDGHNFLFSQGRDSDSKDYFLYHYRFEGKKLLIEDVGLLEGGMDAVTSTEAFRKEVSASLKNPDCLSGRVEYQKQ